MLASGAHVSIGGVEYVLAIDEEPHYHHRFESLFSPTQAIAGEIAKQQIRPEKLLWAWTDWSGGEGGRIYYPQDPTNYDVGSLINATIRGQLTTRPQRFRSAVARAGTNADTGKRPVGISSYANALIAWEDNIITATDAETWSAAQDTTPAMSGADFADAITEGNNAAFLPAAGGPGDVIPVVQADTSTTAWADAHTGTTILVPIVGAVVDGAAYTWASIGGELRLSKKTGVMDNASDWGATLIFSSEVPVTGTWGTDFWTSAVSTETGLFVSFSSKSTGYIWEMRQDVARPYWTAPPGFVIKKLLYHQGILFALGNQVSAGKQFAGIWAIPLSTRSPIFIGAPRKHQNTELTDFSIGCPGAGSTIFVADRVSGKIFIYDIALDALHLFDDLTNGGTGDGMSYGADERISFLAMHGSRLFGATDTSGGTDTSLQVFSYDDLEPANRDDSQSITATVESPEWDFGVPMELKGLIGFYITFKVTDSGTTSGLLANSRIKVSYSIDDSAYTDLTVITSATTPTGAKGRVFQQVSTGSSTVKFSRLKMKITLDNNATAVAPPILFGVTAEAQLLAYAETWDLAVRVENETSNERPTTRANVASFLRDNLEDLATNKNIVTFLDGYRYEDPNHSTTHTVVVEDPDDEIRTPAEGVMRVKLRAIL